MIVFDASTLILIAKIELLEQFLVHSALTAVIPEEVHRECVGNKKAFDAQIIQKAVNDARIEVVSVGNKSLSAKLQVDFSLGQGEAEAIALALIKKARMVGIDDRNGINACKVLGIPFTTAIGFLIRGRKENWIRRSESLAMLAFLNEYGRYKNSTIEDARKRLEEIV